MSIYLEIGSYSICSRMSLLVDFFRAEAKLLEETARPLIDTLGEITSSHNLYVCLCAVNLLTLLLYNILVLSLI